MRISCRVMGLVLGLSWWTLPALTWGQVAHYTLDQHVNDSAGSAHGTAQNGPSYSVGRAGYAITLNGSTQYVTLGTPASLDRPGALTIAAWVNPSTIAGAPRCILCDMNAGGETGQYAFLVLDTGALSLWWYDGATTAANFDSTTTPAGTGTWQHVAATRDGSGNVVLYYNGSALSGSFSSGSASSPIFADPLSVSIGRAGAFDGGYFEGSLDDVRLYDAALTAGQVLALTQAGPPRRPMQY